jgi:hypothetical protein
VDTQDVVARLDKISEQQEELKHVVSGLAKRSHSDGRMGMEFYLPRLGRGLIVGAVLGVFVWPIVLAATADYSSSFEESGQVLTVAALALTASLFIDFGWSLARQAHDVAPWRSPWITHALIVACFVSTILVWDLPFLSALRHQLVNVDTEAEISNIAVFVGLGCAALAYGIGLKGKSPDH